MNKKRKIAITLLTVKNIKRGKLADAVPEFDELSTVIEHSDWHNHEPVLNHLCSVANYVKRIVRDAGAGVRKHLNQKIDRRRRRDLLYLAALLRDIAKKETIVYRDGNTMCPGHEKLGGVKAQTILKRFDLTPKEIAFVADIVTHHGVGHRIVTQTLQELQNTLGVSPRVLRRIYPELILLVYADTAGSYLRRTRPEEFRSRTRFYKAALGKLHLSKA